MKRWGREGGGADSDKGEETDKAVSPKACPVPKAPRSDPHVLVFQRGASSFLHLLCPGPRKRLTLLGESTCFHPKAGGAVPTLSVTALELDCFERVW